MKKIYKKIKGNAFKKKKLILNDLDYSIYINNINRSKTYNEKFINFLKFIEVSLEDFIILGNKKNINSLEMLKDYINEKNIKDIIEYKENKYINDLIGKMNGK